MGRDGHTGFKGLFNQRRFSAKQHLQLRKPVKLRVMAAFVAIAVFLFLAVIVSFLVVLVVMLLLSFFGGGGEHGRKSMSLAFSTLFYTADNDFTNVAVVIIAAAYG